MMIDMDDPINPGVGRAYLERQGRAAVRERDGTRERLNRIKQDYDEAAYAYELANRRVSAYRNALLQEGYTLADLDTLGISA